MMSGKNTVDNTYVLITPARDEEIYIEKTIQSVISQTILPVKWVIVSDGSTDRTDDIVKQYKDKHDFIYLLRRECDCSRNFASQIYAFKAGVRWLNGIEYDFIGKLDADTSFEPDYYQSVLERFQENPNLGIASGTILELDDGIYKPPFCFGSTSRNVPGAVQVFRRQCYEEIGGYIPLEGGHDVVAQAVAQMKGWEVRSFPDIKVLHHRPTGSSYGNILYNRFHTGIKEYSYGNQPLFEIAKCFWRVREKPYVLGSCFRLSGYCWAFLRRVQREVPADVVGFMRHEQIQRLYEVFSKKKNK